MGNGGGNTDPLLIKLGPGLDLPRVEVYSRSSLSSLLVCDGAEGTRMTSQVATSHSPHEIYPPGSM